jgi:CRISPR-associated protein Csm5
MSNFELSLQTLSPLHIGDGDELRQNFDFAVHEGRTYRLNEDAILLAKADVLRPNREGIYPTPGQLLAAPDFLNPTLFRYSLRGFPRSSKTDARLKSFIKDIYDRPYIPGSSLKGAIRTALAWTGWQEVRPHLDRSTLGRSRSWAGQPLERKLFGPDPNHDLLRALHVSDLNGPGGPGSGLMLVNAQVLTRRNAGSPIELEAVAGDVSFTGSLTIDDLLFSEVNEKELHFNNRKHWLDEMIPRIQAHSKARIGELAQWFSAADNCEAIAQFYARLAGASLGPRQALLQIGWGAGWDGKTFWTHLQKDKLLFEQLVTDFRLHKAGRNTPPRRTGDPFPRSKRAVMVVKDQVLRAARPFGWVLIELEEK